MITTEYGTWTSCVESFSTSPEADIVDAVNGGDASWLLRMESSGALDAIAREYRAQINAALPPDVSLCGEQFIGPAYPADGAFEGYPMDEHGALDIKAIVEAIDLDAILERFDVDREDGAE